MHTERLKHFFRSMLSIAFALFFISLVQSVCAQDKKPPANETVIYEADTTDGPGAQWSTGIISHTKDKSHTYIGPYREEEVQFSLDSLPAHQLIRLQFTLLTWERWNGDGGNFGRDAWDLRVLGGQPLIHTTFSNCGFFSNNNEQSFPDQYPWYPTHPGWTGATTHQSLGWKTSQDADSWGCDSTYDFDLVFPHTAESLDLIFKSQIKKHDTKPYGFLSFKVSTVDHASAADKKAIAGWFSDLADEDAVKAYKAAWSLIATGDIATEYISKNFPALGPAAIEVPPNVDVTQMWEYGKFQYDTPALRQRARAAHVLEVINSKAAKAFLDRIGYKGTPQAFPPTRWG